MTRTRKENLIMIAIAVGFLIMGAGSAILLVGLPRGGSSFHQRMQDPCIKTGFLIALTGGAIALIAMAWDRLVFRRS